MLGNFSRKAVKHEDENAIERILEIKKEEKIKIMQFHKNDPENTVSFESLEDLLVDISKTDLGCKTEVRFIFSGITSSLTAQENNGQTPATCWL